VSRRNVLLIALVALALVLGLWRVRPSTPTSADHRSTSAPSEDAEAFDDASIGGAATRAALIESTPFLDRSASAPDRLDIEAAWTDGLPANDVLLELVREGGPSGEDVVEAEISDPRGRARFDVAGMTGEVVIRALDAATPARVRTSLPRADVVKIALDPGPSLIIDVSADDPRLLDDLRLLRVDDHQTTALDRESNGKFRVRGKRRAPVRVMAEDRGLRLEPISGATGDALGRIVVGAEGIAAVRVTEPPCIRGRVVLGGRPVAEAGVEIVVRVEGASEEPRLFAISDRHGVFRVATPFGDGAPPRPRVFAREAWCEDDRAAGRARVVIDREATGGLDLGDLELPAAQGGILRVTDDRGEALAGVEAFSVVPPRGSRSSRGVGEVPLAASDEAGRLTLPSATPAVYLVKAGHVVTRVAAGAAAEKGATARLPRTAVLLIQGLPDGVVVRASAEGPDMAIGAAADRLESVRRWWEPAPAASDRRADELRIDGLPPGRTLRLEAFDGALRWKLREEPSLQPGETRTVRSTGSEPLRSAAGVVVDVAGAAVARAEVTLVPPADAAHEIRGVARTDGSGAFRLGVGPLGAGVRLRVRAQGFLETWADVPDGAADDLRVVVRAARRLKLRVVGRDGVDVDRYEYYFVDETGVGLGALDLYARGPAVVALPPDARAFACVTVAWRETKVEAPAGVQELVVEVDAPGGLEAVLDRGEGVSPPHVDLTCEDAADERYVPEVVPGRDGWVVEVAALPPGRYRLTTRPFDDAVPPRSVVFAIRSREIARVRVRGDSSAPVSSPR
jgi:hypothetical protein